MSNKQLFTLCSINTEGEHQTLGKISLVYDPVSQTCSRPNIKVNRDQTEWKYHISIVDEKETILIPYETELFYTILESEDIPFHAWYVYSSLIDIDKYMQMLQSSEEKNAFEQVLRMAHYYENKFQYGVISQSDAFYVFEQPGMDTVIYISFDDSGKITSDSGLYDIESDTNKLIQSPIFEINYN